MTKPTELHVFDFDGALYDSPAPRASHPSWWYSSLSLSGHGPPGFDHRWILVTVMAARRSVFRPEVRTALLTGRPQHKEMTVRIREMLRSADLSFDFVQLKPVLPEISTPAYKAAAVRRWVKKEPSITSVVFYDDLTENLAAVGKVAVRAGCRYTPVLTPGVS